MRRCAYLLLAAGMILSGGNLRAGEAAPAAAAPPALTLAQSQLEARQNSPEIKRLEAERESASWRRLEAWSAYLPHLSVSANQILAAEYLKLGVSFGGLSTTFPEALPASTIDLNASLTLFDGLEGMRRVEGAGLAYQAADLELRRGAFQLAQTVRLRYCQALAAAALLQVASQNIVTLQEHLAIANASLRSGISTRFNVLRIEAQLEEAQAEKNLAEDNARLARQSLFLAMGEPEDDRPLTGDLPVPDAQAVPAGWRPDPEARDDVQAQRQRQAGAERAAEAAGGFWWPRLSVYAGDEYYRFGSFDPAVLATPGLSQAYTVGARLTWNLFDGGAALARQEQSAHQARAAAQATRALVLRAANDVELWKRRLLYNAALYRARLREQEKSQESVRLATLGLKAGTNTNTEVLDAELDLFRSRAGIIRAQVDAAEALINLELAAGALLAGDRGTEGGKVPLHRTPPAS